MKVRAEVRYSSDENELCIILSKLEGTGVNIGFYPLGRKEELEAICEDFNTGFKTLWH